MAIFLQGGLQLKVELNARHQRIVLVVNVHLALDGKRRNFPRNVRLDVNVLLANLQRALCVGHIAERRAKVNFMADTNESRADVNLDFSAIQAFVCAKL